MARLLKPLGQTHQKPLPKDQNLKPVIQGNGRGASKHMLHRLESLEEELANSLSYTGNSRWMIPYADLLTILLGLFLILLSLSALDNKELNAYANQVQETLQIKQKMVATQNDELKTLQSKLEALQTEKNNSKKAMPSTVDPLLAINSSDLNATPENIQVSQQERGLVISIMSGVLFDSGSAQLSTEARQTLNKLATILKTESHPIRVEGHTDTTPIATSQYASNWELSTARATSIVRFLVEEHQFNPAQLSASGYGEYHPISENSSVQGKQKNRRVDIVVLNKQAIQQEPFSDSRPLKNRQPTP